MIGSFWKEEKNNRFARDKNKKYKYDVKERKTNVTLVDKGKEIGKTVVVKSPNEKSGFWSEKPEKVEKVENFSLEHSSEMSKEIENLAASLDKLNDSVELLEKKIPTLEREFVKHKQYTNEILASITKALKIKIEAFESKVESKTEKVEEKKSWNDIISNEVPEEFDEEKLKRIKLTGSKVYPFGYRRVNVNKDDELSFGFIYRQKDYFAYGKYEEDENKFTYIHFSEFTDEDGKEISLDKIRLPITLEYIPKNNKVFDTSEELNSADTEAVPESSNDSDDTISVPEIDSDSIEENVVEEPVEPETIEPEVIETGELVIEPEIEEVVEEPIEPEVVEEFVEETVEEIVEETVEPETIEPETVEEVVEEFVEPIEPEVVEPEFVEEPVEEVVEEPIEPETVEEVEETVKMPTLPPLKPLNLPPLSAPKEEEEILELPEIRGYVIPGDGPLRMIRKR